MEYLLTFEDGSTRYLEHHGVKGMHWGVWNAETASRYASNGGVIKKGQRLSRVSTSENDPTYFSKKHFSTNAKDHDKWVEYLGKEYKDRGRRTYDVFYEAAKDLKVATEDDLARVFGEKIVASKLYGKRAKTDVSVAEEFLNVNPDNDALEVATRQIAAQTKTGKRILNEMRKEGYQVIPDIHGRNVSKDPIIVIDPDKNLKKTKVKKSRYYIDDGYDLAPKEQKTYDDSILGTIRDVRRGRGF